MAGATVIAYIIGEGLTDAMNVDAGEGIPFEVEVEEDDDTEEE